MTWRISPRAWPALFVTAPVLVPRMLRRNRIFKENRSRAERLNRQRVDQAQPLGLPELDYLELTVLVEEKTLEGFRGDPGVSYLVTTDRGRLLFDVGFGPDSATLGHNAEALGIDFSAVDAVAISHLHPDHMGGTAAYASKQVRITRELAELAGKPCFVPESAKTGDLAAQVVTMPRVLAAGIGSTGPLARSLFFLGMCEEQALVADVRGKGLVVITGCGHPGLPLILDMVHRLGDKSIHAIAGGFHFPVTKSRSERRGIQIQMFFGTGKPPWQKINNDDLSRDIDRINKDDPAKVLVSAHDTCDHSLDRLRRELTADTKALEAGATYRI